MTNVDTSSTQSPSHALRETEDRPTRRAAVRSGRGLSSAAIDMEHERQLQYNFSKDQSARCAQAVTESERRVAEREASHTEFDRTALW